MRARGRRGVRQPDQRHTKHSKIGVDEGDVFLEANARARRVKLPLRPLRIADGHPGASNDVKALVHALDFFRFEVERIVRDEQAAVGTPLDLHRAANLLENAMARAHVVGRLVTIEMLIRVVELDVAARNRFFRLFIEFHVVGAQPRALISDVHIAVGDKQIAAPALRHCREIYDAAFAGGKTGLLPFGALAEKRGRQQENQARAQKKRAERGT